LKGENPCDFYVIDDWVLGNRLQPELEADILLRQTVLIFVFSPLLECVALPPSHQFFHAGRPDIRYSPGRGKKAVSASTKKPAYYGRFFISVNPYGVNRVAVKNSNPVPIEGGIRVNSIQAAPFLE